MAENKKLTAVLLAGALAFYPVINGISVLADDNAGDPEEYSLGDVSGDGAVNTKDIVRLMKFLAGEDVEVTQTDINADGAVNVKDVVRLMKIIAEDDSDYTSDDVSSGEITDDTSDDTSSGEITDDTSDDASSGDITSDTEPETEEPETEESYVLEDIALDSVISDDYDSVIAEDVNAEELLGAALQKSFGESEFDISADRRFYATDNSVSAILKGRAKYRVSDSGSYSAAKVNEIETVNYKDTALLSYYNGENLYIYDEDDPCYMSGNLALKNLDEQLSMYRIFEQLDASAVSGETVYVNNGDYVIVSEIPVSQLEAAGIDVNLLKTNALSQMNSQKKILESPKDVVNVKISFVISQDGGYLKYARISFSFDCILRIDASNTRDKTVVYDYMQYFNVFGEHVPIEEPDGIDDYYLYDASIDIITAIKALYNEDGSKADDFDERYAAICELYTVEAVEEVLSDYGIEI